MADNNINLTNRVITGLLPIATVRKPINCIHHVIKKGLISKYEYSFKFANSTNDIISEIISIYKDMGSKTLNLFNESTLNKIESNLSNQNRAEEINKKINQAQYLISTIGDGFGNVVIMSFKMIEFLTKHNPNWFPNIKLNNITHHKEYRYYELFDVNSKRSIIIDKETNDSDITVLYRGYMNEQVLTMYVDYNSYAIIKPHYSSYNAINVKTGITF